MLFQIKKKAGVNYIYIHLYRLSSLPFFDPDW